MSYLKRFLSFRSIVVLLFRPFVVLMQLRLSLVFIRVDLVRIPIIPRTSQAISGNNCITTALYSVHHVTSYKPTLQ